MRPAPALVLALLAALLVPRLAAADAVPPPPDNCPPGARGTTSHSGTACEPIPCATDADCRQNQPYGEPPRVCRSTRLCIGEEERRNWRRNNATWKVSVARGDCSSACPAGTTCQEALRCVPDVAESRREDIPTRGPELHASGRRGRGCQCDLAAPAEGALPIGAGLLTAVGALAARRRARGVGWRRADARDAG